MTGQSIPLTKWTQGMVDGRALARRARTTYSPGSLDSMAATVWSVHDTAPAARRVLDEVAA